MNIVNSSYLYVYRSVGAKVGRDNTDRIGSDIDANSECGYGEGYG